jgi:hypothetical protein
VWREQKKIIKKSFDFDKDDQETIRDIIQQDQTGEEGRGSILSSNHTQLRV